MKTIINIILYVWQLPQNLLGLLLLAIYRPETAYEYDGARITFSARMPSYGGISLGRYVVLASRFITDRDSIQHEWGHTRQSRMLGPLYLFVVGLPSLLWAAWWNPSRSVSYYSFYTERWADKLGGVKR